jgi:anti-sigma regulatory factor (Ser/Thr protein kinase)
VTTTATLCVHGGLDAPAAVRRWLFDRDDWASEQRRDEVALMLCEVVTNAVLHGGVGSDAELRIDVATNGDVLMFRVYDHGDGFVPPLLDRPERTRGLGLYIVDRLAHRWGVTRVPGGACVWFEALLDGAGRG